MWLRRLPYEAHVHKQTVNKLKRECVHARLFTSASNIGQRSAKSSQIWWESGKLETPPVTEIIPDIVPGVFCEGDNAATMLAQEKTLEA